jgi:hypothetical protein
LPTEEQHQEGRHEDERSMMEGEANELIEHGIRQGCVCVRSRGRESRRGGAWRWWRRRRW